MSLSYSELRKLSTDQLIEKYDKVASTVSNESLDFYLNEIHRKDQEKLNKQMLDYTAHLRTMTIVITVATIINLFIIAFNPC